MSRNELKTGQMPDERHIYELSDLFKMFGESSRLKIMAALFSDELSVGELSGRVLMQQSAVSHQLRILRQARLVKGRREGKSVLYSLADDHIKIIFNMGLEHISETID